MTRSKSFRDLVRQHVETDKAFAEALLREGIDAMLTGDIETGKTILRDYIKATVGFEKLGEATSAPSKSLIRMFGARGNPQARNLFKVIGYLQERAGVRYRVVGQKLTGRVRKSALTARGRGAKVETVRAALIEGESSGVPRVFDAGAFKRKMTAQRG